MNALTFHFVSGDAFYTGMCCLLIGAAVIALSSGHRHRLGSLAILSGWVLATGSAVPHPRLMYLFLTLVSALVIFGRPKGASGTERSNRDGSPEALPMTVKASWLLAVGSICSATWECSVYARQSEHILRDRPIHVIGDSLSAGINDGRDSPWPVILDQKTAVSVESHAVAGATCRSALKQTGRLPESALVIVEIGGNDLLSGRTSSEFSADLETLIKSVISSDRYIVMFELPLPPLHTGYGYAQRELADRYGLTLIPRRTLASVLLSPETTLDSIHLNSTGHQRLADRVSEFLSLASDGQI